jgi:carboxyl-terminal processing protease
MFLSWAFEQAAGRLLRVVAAACLTCSKARKPPHVLLSRSCEQAVPRLLRLAIAACVACSLALALTPEEKKENLESFEYVWKTVRDKHWQRDPAGLDWQAVHDELRPAIEKAETMEAARAVMSAMLARLNQSHFGIIPSTLYSQVDGGHSRTGESTTGIDIRVVGAQALVTSVDPGSGAAAAGVHPGWVILKISGADVAPILEKAVEAYKNSSTLDLMLRRTVMMRLEGKEGDTIEIEFLDGKDQPATAKIVQGNPKGVLARLGYLWPMHVWIETRHLGNIGYVKFNMFLDPTRLMSAFGDAVQSCLTCDGFIVDVRGNPGGIGAMAMGMAGWFIDKPDQRLGTLFMRETTLKFVVYPRPQVFRGPLAILVDGASASTSEIFAGGMKDLGRASIFGSRTAAAALPSFIEVLPNGDGFQYAIANYISEGGKPLEGIGVAPDLDAPITRRALLDGKDPALDAAIEWIKSAKTPLTN